MREPRAVVVGGGLAGLATAYHLLSRGRGPVVVVERERDAGLHSSGRNAAMVRQVVSDPAIAELARRGARAMLALAAPGGPVEFHPSGSLLLASGRRLEALRREEELARQAGLPTERWTRKQAAARVPVLEGADFEEGCFCPADGVVDVAGLMAHYLRSVRQAGGQVLLAQEVSEVLVEGGRVAGVLAGETVIRTRVLVNAAGAWASALGARAGASPIALRSFRRHLVFTGPYPRASRAWPFVWDVAHEVYFRPESDGLLLSPCDEEEDVPGVPEVDPAALRLLHDKLARHLPALADVPVARSWAGLRVFAPDNRFVIGPDPSLEGFFWVAGLGGHGVTTCEAVGALAADLVERPELDRENPFSPARLGAHRTRHH